MQRKVQVPHAQYVQLLMWSGSAAKHIATLVHKPGASAAESCSTRICCSAGTRTSCGDPCLSSGSDSSCTCGVKCQRVGVGWCHVGCDAMQQDTAAWLTVNSTDPQQQRAAATQQLSPQPSAQPSSLPNNRRGVGKPFSPLDNLALQPCLAV